MGADFWAKWRKSCKQVVHSAVRRELISGCFSFDIYVMLFGNLDRILYVVVGLGAPRYRVDAR